MEPIQRRYLLVTFVPTFVDDDGSVWLERLWHHDLCAHLPYLPHLVLAAPELHKREGTDLVRLEQTVARVALPPMRNSREALRHLPATTAALWRAIGDSEVVHSGIAGWPLPIGWIANPIAIARGRFLLVNVESAPWRVRKGEQATVTRRVRGVVTEMLGRFYAKRADLLVVTHDGYAKDLGSSRAHVIPASWIQDDDVLTADAAVASWSTDKVEGPVRALFVGRLVEDKGVGVLLDALPHLHGVELVCLGAGALAPALVNAGVRVLDPVPYGEPFFRVVRAAHVVVVPTLSDEQPRILYDAASQAVSCVATDTPGNRAMVRDGDNGALVPRGDAAALARALMAPVKTLRARGLAAVDDARAHTHEAMHEQRRVLLERTLRG